jgi:hypothetical protein
MLKLALIRKTSMENLMNHRMGTVILLAASALASIPAYRLSAQGQRGDYVSEASFLFGTWSPKSREHSPAAMATAAQAFLDSLNVEQRKLAMHSLDSPERRAWTNLPPREDAGGIRIGLLDEAQVKSLCDLMATLFSEKGYKKMIDIMLADDQLTDPARPRPGFGTDYFSVVLFGKPSATDPWAFQLDGHHIGVNISLSGDHYSMSPSFIGTQPEAFELSKDVIRPLAAEIDAAFRLVSSLNDDQRRAAVIRPQRGQIVTGPGNDDRVPEVAGVCCASFSDSQKQLVMELIGQWTGNMPARPAGQRLAEIRTELDQTFFSWNGAITPGSDISWRIQGPSVIIEYACQEMGGNPQNHLHTMYRNPRDEYGRQIPPDQARK